MKIGIYTANYTSLSSIVESVRGNLPYAEIHVYGTELKECSTDSKIFISDCQNSLIKDKDIIINTIGIKKAFSKKYQEISAKYKIIDIFKAEKLMDLIRAYDIARELDTFAAAVKDNASTAIIINVGEPSDLITLYLYKAHGIVSYGISRKADNLVDSMLCKLNLRNYSGKVNYKLAGIENCLWVYELTDKKKKDLLPELRDKVKDIDLNVKRADLLRDPLRSLKFYGYYHSFETLADSEANIISKAIKAITEGDKTVYFNAINNETIKDIDKESVVEIPFIMFENVLARESVDLPLQCVLAMTDKASAVSLAVQCLMTMSRELFIRTVKLNPYLSSILTLKELQNVAEDILAIEQEISSKLV